MPGASAFLVFGLGFFALVAQTLLLRQYLSAFAADEPGIACFFGAWLLWIAAGAWLSRRSRLREGLLRHFAFAPLLYLPASLLQSLLIASARTLGGVAAFEAFPLGQLVGLSLLANAAVSLLTGLLFALACGWVERHDPQAVSRVYVLESLGACAGGVAVTLLLRAHLRPETIFVGAALPLALAPLLRLGREPGRRLSAWAPLVVLLGVLVLRGDAAWARWSDRAAWGRLLPPSAWGGHFATAQADYLYGQYQGQFAVVSAGAVTEALPDSEAASQVVALALAQHPAARRVLVVGPGSLSVCQRLLRLPAVERVVWLHLDPDYPDRLLAALPPAFRPDDPRLEVPRQDVRDYARAERARFDLIVLHVPDPTTLYLNRYSTREFFQLLRGALDAGGVLAVRVTGGANYMGEELVHLGATALTTLRAVFATVVLKPGDETWMLAGDGQGPSASADLLQQRFASVPGGARVYPAEAIPALYPPDRIAFQMAAYEEAMARTGPAWLLNSDAHPRALLYALLLALRKLGWATFGGLTRLAAGGAAILTLGLLLLALLRAVYRLRSAPGPAGEPRADLPGTLGDADGLVFTAGLLGMSQSVLLMFLFQARYGSLFLYAGLVGALFMGGCVLGGLAMRAFLGRRRREPRVLLPALVLPHLGLLLLVARLADAAGRGEYGALFVLGGAVTGAYFPVAAGRVQRAGQPAAVAGARLEGFDHLGGCLGAATTGLLLLPLLGMRATALLLGLLLAGNLLSLLPAGAARPQPADGFDRRARPVGYLLFGVAVFALMASRVLARLGDDELAERLAAEGAAMAGGAALEPRTLALSGGGRLSYYRVPGTSALPEGFVFPSMALAEGISGYGGPIALAVYVDAGGRLRDYRILRAGETPAYLRFLAPWMARLPGRDLTAAAPFAGIDAVSGATLTCAALLRTLQTAGAAFAGQALGLAAATPAPPAVAGRWRPDRSFVVLLALLLAALGLRRVPRRRAKQLLALAALGASGIWLNLQYSSQQVFALLGGRLPALAATAPAFLVLGVPLVVLLVGNIYCGYLCPFGALQELLADLRPPRWSADPCRQVWRWGRAVKYLLLFLLAGLFALTRDAAVLAADPLVTLFGPARTPLALGLGLALIAASLCYSRFWCRNLCPAGAFLALLNGAQLLRRILPRLHPGRCDLGVRTRADLDCLVCDRCRHAPQ